MYYRINIDLREDERGSDMYIRKIISGILVMCLLLSTSIIVGAETGSGLTGQQKAETLYQLNVVSGDGKGNFNLNGQLKRSEAASFIVKMLGKTDFVSSNKDKYKYTNFPDVKPTDWFAPAVGYCVEQGIIGGYPNGNYGPNDSVSEKAFLKMVLQALGYRNGIDYDYNTTLYQYAFSLGLVRDESYQTKVKDDTKYLRAKVIDVLFESMTQYLNGTTETMIQLLVRQGSVTKAKAIASGLLIDSIDAAVKEIVPNNSVKLTLKFSEPIKNISDSSINIYETTNKANKLTAAITSQNGDELVLKTSGQTVDKAYTIEITNITDMQGNFSSLLTANFTGFKATEIKSDFFKISKIDVVSKNMINVYFTHPVNVNSEDPAYYEIYDGSNLFVKGSTSNMSVGLLGSSNNAVSIFLKDRTFTEGTEYTLRVSGDLTSIYGVKLGMNNGDSMTFVGKALENEEFKLVSSYLINSKTLRLDFNKELSPDIGDWYFSYFRITDSSNNVIDITKAVLTGDNDMLGKCVLLTANYNFDKTKTYNIMINNLSDVTGQYNTINQKKYTFSGSYSDTSSINLVNVTPTDAGTITVYFDKPLDETSAGQNGNFSISGITHTNYYALPSKTYFNKANPYVVKLFLPSDKLLEGTKTYKLRVQPTLCDSLGNQIGKTLELGFNGSGSNTAKPSISRATIISNDTIKVTFNKEIALDVPNILPSNYSLEYTLNSQTLKKVPLSVNYIDGTTISLKFDKLDTATSYKLKFATLKDYSGNNITSDKDTDTSVLVVNGQ